MAPTGTRGGADPARPPAGASGQPAAGTPGAPSAPGGRAGKPAPALLAEHAHLTLADLRGYRSALQDEEGVVSYWRRILQARLDVVRAGAPGAGTRALEVGQLRSLLSEGRVGAGRTALLSVVSRDDIPPLPDLGDLWERVVVPDDEDARARLEADLLAAEERLSDYRRALLKRLDEATGELVARYRTQPVLCLTALPLPKAPPLRAVAGRPARLPLSAAGRPAPRPAIAPPPATPRHQGGGAYPGGRGAG